jgi:hypothetical protein
MSYPEIVETVGSAIDIAGVILIIAGLLIAAGRYLLEFRSEEGSYTVFRQDRPGHSAWSGGSGCRRHHQDCRR